MKYDIICISDVHLRSSGCQAEELHTFLKENKCHQLILVGDIFDLWTSNNWNKHCNSVVRSVLKAANDGTQVIYVTGNHDDALRSVTPLSLGNIQIVDEYILEYYGNKYMVIHGDKFDLVNRTVSIVGGVLYDWVLVINDWVFKCRKKLGIQSHWSLSKYVKTNTKKVLAFISNFKTILATYAYENECQGVICGHIHTPEITEIHLGNFIKVDYYNCGDWVENCTALVAKDGKWEIK